MQVNQERLRAACRAGILSGPQADALWDFLAAEPGHAPTFRAAHVLTYLGGMIAIGAMTLFMTLAWEALGGAGMLALALVYALIGLVLTEWLVRRPGSRVPAGLAATLVAAVVPLGMYGLLHWLGWWHDASLDYRDLYTRVDLRWVSVELVTVVVASLLLWRYRLPLLTLPIAVALWFLAIDLSAAWPDSYDTPRAAWACVVFGVGAILLAIVLDLRQRRRKLPDLSFWFYLCGAAAFFSGTTWFLFSGAGLRLGYLVVQLVLIALGTLLRRRVLVVFGGLGLAALLCYWAYDLFADSLWFPVILSLAGLAIAALGLLWHRHQARVHALADAWVPTAWRGGPP